MTRTPVDDAAERRQRRIALAIALLLNIGFLVTMSRLMTVHPPVAEVPKNAFMLLRLIDPPVPPSAPSFVDAGVEPPSPPAYRVPRPHARLAAASSAPAAAEAAPVTPDTIAASSGPSKPLTLFSVDGTVLIPLADTAQPVKDFPTRPRGADSDLFVHRSPLPYTPTRLEKAWIAPINETLGGELLRKASASKTWRTPWGTQVSCTWVLIVGGCGWGYAPNETIEEMQRDRADPPMPKTPAQVPGVAAPAIPTQ